jgi:hypothetical protein
MPPSLRPRILGCLTAAYGAYTLVRPHSLMRATGLETGDIPLSQQRTGIGRAIGARDLVSGAAMMLLAAGPPLRAAVVARVVCDVGDAIGFGRSVPVRFRARVIGVAGAWGLLCATTFRAAGHAR